MKRSEVEDQQNVPWYEDIKLFAETDKQRPLTDEEWKVVINPDDNWVFTYNFDTEFFEGIDTRELHGHVVFDASTTIKDFMSVLASLRYRYGWFEGLKKHNRNKYILLWGN
jgi:hypothetical protein